MLTPSNGKALQRPILSPDGTFLALIAPDKKVHLINLAEAVHDQRFITAIKVPKSTRPFLQECHILRWSPETAKLSTEGDDILSNTTSECDFGLRWLLLSNGARLIALSTDLKSPKMMPRIDDREDSSPSNILADYDLGGQLGKLSLAEFVFDHRHALVMFEFSSTAAILSLTKPQREEIPHAKFPDSRSFTVAPHNRQLALLRREKGQDRITVFEMDEGNKITYQSFDANTSDAQSVTWCPAGDPVVAVCESPSYGVKVSFFTAQGHALKQLDISAATFTMNLPPIDQPLDIDTEGPGLTHWQWRHDGNRSIQIAANGQKQVVIRYQPTNSLSTQILTAFTHPNIIDGSHTFVWQETPSPQDSPLSSTFVRQTGIHDPTEPDTKNSPDPAQIDIISLNANHTIIATRIRSAPRTLLLWRTQHINTGNPRPHTSLSFTHPIKQVHWHPILANVLIILTTRKTPLLYAWYQERLSPISGLIPIDTTSTNYSVTWLPACTRNDDVQRRCPIMITSSTAFEIGYVESLDAKIVFDSIINRANDNSRLLEEGQEMSNDTTHTEIDIDTPSRKPRGTKKTRFEVDPNPRTDKEDPVFAQARWGRW